MINPLGILSKLTRPRPRQWGGRRVWLLVVLTAGSMMSAVHAAARESAAASPRTLLFVDDHHILYRSGTQRHLQPLQRSTVNPLISGRDKPWEVAVAWMSVYRHPATGKYQLWYQAFAGAESKDRTRRCTVCYAESDDGVHFTKPNLGLFDFNGVKETNIVLIANGGKSDRYGVSVVVNQQEKDPSRRYKMAYYDFTTTDGYEYPGLNVAFSPDGIHWTKHLGGPQLRGSYGEFGTPVPMQKATDRRWSNPLAMSDALDVLWDESKRVFAIYGKMWIDGPDGGMYWKHAMGRTESTDFVRWSKPQLLLTPDDRDPPWVEFHTTPVFIYNETYFSPLQILDRATGGGAIDIELATSRDGLNWQRNYRKPFWLARTDGNRFDSGSIFLRPQPVVLVDEIRFYYGAYSQGATSANDLVLTTGIGMASLPRDRFAGVRSVARTEGTNLKQPLNDIGQLTLKSLHFTGNESLQLNANAPNGIRVELLDADGRRIEGFTMDDAVEIKGDSLRHEVRWKGRPVSLPAGDYLVRIHLNKATVYAMTILPQ